ncbi:MULTISPECIES: hypothetical protein [Chitinophagaceae]|uniref:hypothetical protein n=1 Tax=Chitinophagaceae TaxID=563835 RepID=UPI000DEF4F22|nr:MULTISPECIES: hypothetical protein [Chitinophagaceae]RPD48889.1 hypothetical protein DRJ53_09510 [Paracnuella aquatica]
MNNKIRTYEDLLEEQKRLMNILKGHETLLKTDVAGVRQGLKPVGTAFNFVNKMATRDHTGPMMNFGLEFGLDLLLRRFVLARAGWFTKIAIPYVVKNYASHLITEEKREILMQKINAFMQKLRPKPGPTAYTPEEAAQDPRKYYPGGAPPPKAATTDPLGPEPAL